MVDDSTNVNPIRKAEQAVLASMLASPIAINDVSPMLTGSMFSSPFDEYVYDAILYVYTESGHIDQVLVSDRLQKTGKMKFLPGGAVYLFKDLSISQGYLPASAAYYAEIVASAYQSRQLTAALQTASDALSQGLDPSRISADLEKTILDMNLAVSTAKPELAGEGFADAIDRLISGESGLSTGIRDFDEKFNGIEPATLNLLAGRPGTGKSVVALTIAKNLAKRGIPVMFYSLEMTLPQVLIRLLNAECRIPTNRLNLSKPKLTDQDWEKISSTVEKLMDIPLYIADEVFDLETIVSQIHAFKKKHPQAVVFIDYLQLVGTKKPFGAGDRQAQVSHISRTLKLTSQKTEIPIWALSQLNRASESRSDKKPQLADLRESGSLEQDANNVFLLFREDLLDPESSRAGELDIIGAKVRATGTGTVAVAAQMHYMLVSDMATSY